MESSSSIESDDYIPSTGQIFNNRYAVIDKLGSGAFSTVWRCLDNITNRMVALKIQKSSGSCTTAAKKEAKILGEIDHPNIIKLLSKFTYYDPQPTTVKYRCLVFELCDGDLYDLMVNKIKYKQIKEIIRDIMTGLSVIHARKIIHTDIKPENILLLGNC
jgi:serine/threonine protein kinase